jgi:hypothetical protein
VLIGSSPTRTGPGPAAASARRPLHCDSLNNVGRQLQGLTRPAGEPAAALRLAFTVIVTQRRQH